MEITGTIKVKGETAQVSEKFKKRDFVITTEGEYPQHISLQLAQDKCGLIEKYKEGDEIKCHINLRGREWVDKDGKVKYFNTIDCWKIEGIKWDEPVQGQSATAPTGEGDDLSF